ncbi:hypothetical protein NA56DRAFT_708301 [Hyaloscypha hepaticicola]|uniref:Uncharacterized protein n=1 Tax=Hyaloscypha hepaticicola TaxID=2082293 RepID=A0A2J6PRT4_9HELO|nr:hypothetical protein NA56DRAFT_708301 [Hyaloscypha hepaticicola]
MAPALPLPLQLFKRACEASDGYVCYHMPIPAVIGIVFGCAFLLITGIFITFLCCKCRRHKKKLREQGESANDDSILAYNGAKRGETIDFNPHAF